MDELAKQIADLFEGEQGQLEKNVRRSEVGLEASKCTEFRGLEEFLEQEREGKVGSCGWGGYGVKVPGCSGIEEQTGQNEGYQH